MTGTRSGVLPVMAAAIRSRGVMGVSARQDSPRGRPRSRDPPTRAYFRSDVQCGQRTALTGTAVAQNGQSFVAGAGAGASDFFFSLFMARMIRKRTKATIRKLMTALMNLP